MWLVVYMTRTRAISASCPTESHLGCVCFPYLLPLRVFPACNATSLVLSFFCFWNVVFFLYPPLTLSYAHPPPPQLAFCVPAHTPLRPVVSLSACQKLRFGLEASTLKFPVEGATPIANTLLSPSLAKAAATAKPPCMPFTPAVPVSMPVVVATPVTAAVAATTPVPATPVPKAQPMKFGLHPGPFFIVDRAKASHTNPGYLKGFVCDVKDVAVCSQTTDTHNTWLHCPGEQYDVCRGCFHKYIVPAFAAPNHFLVVPTP